MYVIEISRRSVGHRVDIRDDYLAHPAGYLDRLRDDIARGKTTYVRLASR